MQTIPDTASYDLQSTQQKTCCIVGGGPAGVVLSLLLARQRIPVMLLESHHDFDRDFRGDTIHPSVMEIMAELGLAERLLRLHHTKLYQLALRNSEGSVIFTADFSRLKTRYPYIVVMPQVQFLNFIVEEAKRFSNFQLVLGANVQELIEEAGIIRGVRYRGHGGWHEVRALLTVGADGRHSHLRQLAGFEPIKSSPPMDVLWFRLPRKPEEPEGLNGRIGRGRFVAMLDRTDSWQIAYVISKGGYQKIRAAGLEALQQSVLEVIPEFGDRITQLKRWSQVAFLSVESSRCPRWHRPGLLLIGDAAHVMSPVGGVGINYAIQDAVVATNVLSHSLKSGRLHPGHLAIVQRQRELPTRVIQALQALMQKQLVTRALDPDQPFTPPILLRLSILRDLLPRLIALGIFPVHLKHQTNS